MDSTRIVYPRDQALDENSAMDEIFNLFPDHYPELISENNENWIFRLNWPVTPEWYVDPSVLHYAKDLFELMAKQVASYTKEFTLADHIDFLISMFHSRAILAAVKANRRLEKSITHIVHIDDHDDLMPIIDFFDHKHSTNIIDISNFIQHSGFKNPTQVLQAITRGFINMGNFLTFYLLFNSPGELLIVNPKGKKNEGWLQTEHLISSLANRTIYQTGLYISNNKLTNYSWHCHWMQDIPSSVPGSNEDKIWLDIDLDVFCNRYNRDSTNLDRKASKQEKVKAWKLVNKIFKQLYAANWLYRVEAVSISISPGFFPADYWAEFIPVIVSKLTNMFSNQSMENLW